jgi:hypothetical protein
LIVFSITGRDAPVEISVHSMAANPKNPSRVSLTVMQQVKRKQKQQQDSPEAQAHVSRIERDLAKLEQKVDMILTTADCAKEQEVDFHVLSLAVNRASQYWPIFICLFYRLLANHITRLFKSQHTG